MTAPPALQDVYGVPVPLGRLLAQGRHADLLTLSEENTRLAKVYLTPPPPAQAQKVEEMVKTPPHPDVAGRLVWPLAALYGSNRQLAGLLLPLLPPQEFQDLRSLLRPDLRRRDFPAADWPFAVRVGRELALAFAELHAAGHHMGDVWPGHVLVSGAGEVRLVGADDYGLHLVGRGFAGPVASAAYLPPERQRAGSAGGPVAEADAESDAFGLAVLLFELLLGRHPYAGIHARGTVTGPGAAIMAGLFVDSPQAGPGVRPAPGEWPFAALPPTVQALFVQAFAALSPERAVAAPRPSPLTWAAALNTLAAELVPCPRRSGHWQVPGRPCPECAAEREGLEASGGVASGETASGQTVSGVPAGEDVQARVQRLWQLVQRVPAPPPAPPVAPVIGAPPLPPLPLALPDRPRGLNHRQQLQALTWTLRTLVLAALMLGVGLVQRSVLAGLVVPAIVVFALTLGRRFAVDWDGLIDRYERWEHALVRGLMPRHSPQRRYRRAVRRRRAEVKSELAARVAQREELRERYHAENAAALHLREQQALEGRRAQLLSLGAGGSREALLDRWRERTRHDFLRQQLLSSGGVPGVGPRELGLAVSRGIRTALEVDAERVRPLPAPLGRELLAWRRSLEDFFQFDPGVVPRAELSALQQRGQQHLGAEIEDFERAVRAFAGARWDRHEAEISRQLGVLEREIEQHSKALSELRAIRV